MTRKSPYYQYDVLQVATSVVMGDISLVPEIEENQQHYSSVLVMVLLMCMKPNPEERPIFKDIVSMFDVALSSLDTSAHK